MGEYERMRAARAAQLAEVGDVVAVPEAADAARRVPVLVVSNPAPPDPEPVSPTAAAIVGVSMGLLAAQALLVGLRVAEVVTWDWTWVLTPLWLPSLAAIVGSAASGGVMAVLDARRQS